MHPCGKNKDSAEEYECSVHSGHLTAGGIDRKKEVPTGCRFDTGNEIIYTRR